MLIRLFNYAVSDEEGYKRIDDSHAVFKMPQQAVVFLKDTDKSKDKLYIKLILPDEQEIEYSVHAVRSLGYTPAGTDRKRHGDPPAVPDPETVQQCKKVQQRFSEEQKNGISRKVYIYVQGYNHDFAQLKRNRKKITNDEHSTMITIIRDLEKHIYSSIDDIANKGADSMLNEEFLFSDERARAEERAKAEAEEKTENRRTHD
ncbi:hypothetical protein [Ruminococcus sp. HUN007]|uniref:hypothetical protein n=1 Tax=Ruminococcus sp. HUN007 TaxID=1514668 RepID=UPI0005D1AEBD|nr:hypothetical protein [Ruminococcus sp. HUN007]